MRSSDRENAAVEREAGDAVHHRLRGGIDGDGVGQRRDQVGERVEPVRGDQQRLRAERGRGDQHRQHDASLRHEQPVAADEVALADVAIGVDARVGGIGDGDDLRHRGAVPVGGGIVDAGASPPIRHDGGQPAITSRRCAA